MEEENKEKKQKKTRVNARKFSFVLGNHLVVGNFENK